MAVVQRRRIRSKRRRELLDEWQARRRMLNVLKAHAEEIKRGFEDVVADWSDENRPKFTIETKATAKELRVTVRPYRRRKASRIFTYVDKGTRGPYIIRPRRRRPKRNTRETLAFRLGYQPKTLPVARAHVGPGKATAPWVFPKQVKHPGIKARKFSETVRKDTLPEFRKAIERLFRQMEREARKKLGVTQLTLRSKAVEQDKHEWPRE